MFQSTPATEVWPEASFSIHHHSPYMSSYPTMKPRGSFEEQAGVSEKPFVEANPYYDECAQGYFYYEEPRLTWDLPVQNFPITTAHYSLRYDPSHFAPAPSFAPYEDHLAELHDVSGFESPSLPTQSTGGSVFSYSSRDHLPHPRGLPVSPLSALSPISTTSPSEASTSPASTSSLSHDLTNCPPSITLHQPRPLRPIPIVPLSNLASYEQSTLPPCATVQSRVAQQPPSVGFGSDIGFPMSTPSIQPVDFHQFFRNERVAAVDAPRLHFSSDVYNFGGVD